MKKQLLDLDTGTKFRLANIDDVKVPPASRLPQEIIYTFGHLDGMYSYLKGEDGNTYHFAAWTEVEVIG